MGCGPSKGSDMTEFLVSTFYSCDGLNFDRDAVATLAAGGEAEESGWGMGERDLGWICETKSEADEIAKALEKVGFEVDISEWK